MIPDGKASVSLGDTLFGLAMHHIVGTEDLKRFLGRRKSIVLALFCTTNAVLSHVRFAADVTHRVMRIM